MEQLRPGGSLWNKLVLFLESFDPVQMRYAGHEWRKLIDYVEQIARATGTVCIHHEDEDVVLMALTTKTIH